MNGQGLTGDAAKSFQTTQLAMAVTPPKTVCFEYTDAAGDVSTREVEPYEFKNGELVAHCLTKEATRRFKIERMKNVREGKIFRPKYPIVVPM